ncbi:hypothetical protein Droror1_Dr00000388, partial [Drosera rotundifolia]
MQLFGVFRVSHVPLLSLGCPAAPTSSTPQPLPYSHQSPLASPTTTTSDQPQSPCHPASPPPRSISQTLAQLSPRV